MARYMIVDTLPCYVSFTYEVDAESEEEARRLYKEGQADFIEPEIGDAVDDCQQYIEIIKIP